MSKHEMMTRSKKKIQNDENSVIAASSSEAKQQAEPTRLTEDLLYVVNKKLRSMDKTSREKKLHEIFPRGYLLDSSLKHFDQSVYVVYRTGVPEQFSQIEFAVMHTLCLNSKATAAFGIYCMDNFEFALRQPSVKDVFFDPCKDISKQEADDLVRFVQLPGDYKQQMKLYEDTIFFPELSWDESGERIVEFEKFALLMIIHRLKRWLAIPSEYYPLCDPRRRAMPNDRSYCNGSCSNLLHAMWTDDFLRGFFQEQGIQHSITDWAAEGLDEWGNEPVRPETIDEARRYMNGYSYELLAGTKKISETNRAINVLASVHLTQLAEKLRMNISCYDYMARNSYPW